MQDTDFLTPYFAIFSTYTITFGRLFFSVKEDMFASAGLLVNFSSSLLVACFLGLVLSQASISLA